MTNQYQGNIELQSSNQRIQQYDDSDETDEITTSTLKKRILQTVIDFISILIIFGTFILVYFLVDPKIRGFHCTDIDIFNPYKDDTVEFWVVGIYATIAPILFIIFVELINSKLICCKSKAKNFNSSVSKKKLFIVSMLHGLSLFLLGIAVTLLLTEIGKRWVGRLRPHFISQCKPDYSTMNCSTTYGTSIIYNYIDTSGSFCKNDAKLVKEARLSFPSGHSSYSCYCMLFLIIYLEARLNLLAFRFVKPLIQMTAFIAAYVTCLSRISDYHHRGSDVIGGTVLGCMIAIFVTFYVGKVLWKYNYKYPSYDFDLKYKKIKNTNSITRM